VPLGICFSTLSGKLVPVPGAGTGCRLGSPSRNGVIAIDAFQELLFIALADQDHGRGFAALGTQLVINLCVALGANEVAVGCRHVLLEDDHLGLLTATRTRFVLLAPQQGRVINRELIVRIEVHVNPIIDGF